MIFVVSVEVASNLSGTRSHRKMLILYQKFCVPLLRFQVFACKVFPDYQTALSML